MGETIRDALRWLGSPFTAGALAVLALNDHVLKQAWPGLVTGKLSDAAGLVVAPPLVALLLALARVRWSPLLVTGVGFAVVKTLPLAADAASAALGWVAGPSYVRADPTDLLTLPALLLAHHARRTSTEATSLRRRSGWSIGRAAPAVRGGRDRRRRARATRRGAPLGGGVHRRLERSRRAATPRVVVHERGAHGWRRRW